MSALGPARKALPRWRTRTRAGHPCLLAGTGRSSRSSRNGIHATSVLRGDAVIVEFRGRSRRTGSRTKESQP
ncbi:hypothetical protein [Streptomyces griseorubiginosus]|uniref:hypothetical protein n=1 Tax=Streptomyces griseorubiginosus TaxID=67304 RepID=UPI003656FA68